jgi:hypothetical protein
MEATLASEDFDVKALDEARKLVASGQDTEWLWQITPRHSGKLHLFLTLHAIIDVKGKQGAYKAETFSRTLTINVGLWDRAHDFVDQNWQWLLTVLVPVGLWGWRRRAKASPPLNDGAEPPNDGGVPPSNDGAATGA